MAKGNTPPNAGVALPIDWHFPENLQSRYANHMLVQFDEHEFHVSFFEAAPPILIGSPEELDRRLKELKSIRATCVARIVIPQGKMQDFITALQSSFERRTSKPDSDNIHK